ncbi:MAG: hypothetical protein H7Y04_00725, partial [Verrucomicrobia bacterium]|nr:hypothetical protein [Cytophagales bacterium]
AISGGPIYFADSVGKSNPEILKKLTLTDGTILRADQPAVPTEDCLFNVWDAKPLKVFSKSNGTGLLGVFNAADAEKVEGFFSPKDIDGLDGKNFAVFDYLNRSVKKMGLNEQIPVSLARMGYQLYFVKPIVQGFASFGLIEKYNAPKTIKQEIAKESKVLIELYESGTFAAFIEKRPSKVESANAKPLEYTWKAGLLLVKVPEGNNTLTIQF